MENPLGQAKSVRGERVTFAVRVKTLRGLIWPQARFFSGTLRSVLRFIRFCAPPTWGLLGMVPYLV